jgi:hypothetical protein
MKAQRGFEVYSTLSLTSTLDGGGWLMPCPDHFPLGKRDPVPLVQEAGWAPGPVWTSAENLASTDFFLYSLVLCTSSVLVSLH